MIHPLCASHYALKSSRSSRASQMDRIVSAFPAPRLGGFPNAFPRSAVARNPLLRRRARRCEFGLREHCWRRPGQQRRGDRARLARQHLRGRKPESNQQRRLRNSFRRQMESGWQPVALHDLIRRQRVHRRDGHRRGQRRERLRYRIHLFAGLPGDVERIPEELGRTPECLCDQIHSRRLADGLLYLARRCRIGASIRASLRDRRG